MEIVTEIQKSESIQTKAEVFKGKLTAYFELTKPRIAFMLVLTAAAGFYLGSKSSFDWWLFAKSIFAITLLAFGVASLNQFLERKTDALMKRTAGRPLPSGRLSSVEALIFGLFLCVVAEVLFFTSVNALTGFLGLLVIVGYVLLYTPLKTKTTLSTAIGTIPGAMPPLIGWTSATNQISIEAWLLFAIILLWQFPHFLAIAWMYRDEYERAGILMLPVVDKEGKLTVRQVMIFTGLLFIVSLVPFFIGLGGIVYLFSAIALGAYFLYCAFLMAKEKSFVSARKVLVASVIYLPVIFALMALSF
ncbi:MAG: protoheme IX farnesyltransferase [Acidobacteria bacterium]|jgi:protoheme IX farnesyltransferase|nr:MAG: protoheme IX farnesyltransferase [Acidobacteriota bacterium]